MFLKIFNVIKIMSTVLKKKSFLQVFNQKKVGLF